MFEALGTRSKPMPARRVADGGTNRKVNRFPYIGQGDSNSFLPADNAWDQVFGLGPGA